MRRRGKRRQKKRWSRLKGNTQAYNFYRRDDKGKTIKQSLKNNIEVEPT